MLSGTSTRQIEAGLLQRRPVRLERALHQAGQLAHAALQLNLPGGDARDVQQVVHQAHHVPDLPLHHPSHPLHRVAAVAAEPNQLEAGADRRQRIAQLVRQHGQELVLPPVAFEQLLFAERSAASVNLRSLMSAAMPTSRTARRGLPSNTICAVTVTQCSEPSGCITRMSCRSVPSPAGSIAAATACA